MQNTARLSRTIATWFGCGYSPVAPGTVGSLAAVPLHYLLSFASPWSRWTVVVAVTLAGVWSAQRVAEEFRLHDPQIVVIDEVAGVLIALGLVAGHGSWGELLAFVLFRALDITKPGPVALAEKARPIGLGIMLDDVVAGFLAGIAARLVIHWAG